MLIFVSEKLRIKLQFDEKWLTWTFQLLLNTEKNIWVILDSGFQLEIILSKPVTSFFLHLICQISDNFSCSWLCVNLISAFWEGANDWEPWARDWEGSCRAWDGGASDLFRLLQPLHADAPDGGGEQAVKRPFILFHSRTVVPGQAEATATTCPTRWERMWAKHLVSQVHYGLWLMTIDSDYTHHGLLRSRGIEVTSLGLLQSKCHRYRNSWFKNCCS